MDIVIASENLHKVRELRTLLREVGGWDVYSLRDFPEYSPPEEKGETFEENAVEKARRAAHALRKWVLADDSGLIIPSLGNAPGVHSRRWAGEEATDGENRKKLLHELMGKEGLERTAYFACSIAIASPDGIEKVVEGRCEGVIVHQEKGNNGFGYDSLFVKYDYDKTFAELSEDVKNRISHRRKAFEKLTGFLHGLLQQQEVNS